jgi:hypothetical protein
MKVHMSVDVVVAVWSSIHDLDTHNVVLAYLGVIYWWLWLVYHSHRMVIVDSFHSFINIRQFKRLFQKFQNNHKLTSMVNACWRSTQSFDYCGFYAQIWTTPDTLSKFIQFVYQGSGKSWFSKVFFLLFKMPKS